MLGAIQLQLISKSTYKVKNYYLFFAFNLELLCKAFNYNPRLSINRLRFKEIGILLHWSNSSRQARLTLSSSTPIRWLKCTMNISFQIKISLYYIYNVKAQFSVLISVCPLVHTFVHTSVRPSVCLHVRSSVCLFVLQSIYSWELRFKTLRRSK